MKTVQMVLLIMVLCSCTSQSNPPQEVTTSSENSQTDQLADGSAAARPAASAKSKFVCRRERSTGTHMTKTICRTRKQIEEDRTEAEQVMNDARVFGGQPSQ